MKDCDDCVWLESWDDGHRWHYFCSGQNSYGLNDATYKNAETCPHYIFRDEKGWKRQKEIIKEYRRKEKNVIQEFITTNPNRATNFIYNLLRRDCHKEKVLKEMLNLIEKTKNINTPKEIATRLIKEEN